MKRVPRLASVLVLTAACGYGYDDAGPLPPGKTADASPDQPPQADATPGEPDGGPTSTAMALWCYGDGVEDNRTQLVHFALDGDTASMVGALPSTATGELYNVDDGAGSGVFGAYAVSPDGRFVAMAADLEVAGRFDLYVMPITGTDAVQRVAMTADADVDRVLWSPDGQHLAFRADLDVDGSLDVYVVDAASTDAAVRRSPARTGDAALLDARDMMWTTSGDALVFTGDFTEDLYLELWRAELAGGETALLGRDDITATAVGQKGALGLIRAAGEVLFRGKAHEDGRFKLLVADGDGVAVLSNSAVERADASIADVGAVGLSPDGLTLAFAADPLATAYEIYAMPTDGSAAATRLSSGTVAVGRNPEHPVPLAFDRTGSHIAFLADYATDGKLEPYAVPVAGGGELRLAAIAGDGNQDAIALTWGARGDLYIVADHEVSNDSELFHLPAVAADQTPAKLLDVPAGGDLAGCALSTAP